MTAQEKRNQKVDNKVIDEELKNIYVSIKIEQELSFIQVKKLSDLNRAILEHEGYKVVKVVMKGETFYNISW